MFRPMVGKDPSYIRYQVHRPDVENKDADADKALYYIADQRGAGIGIDEVGKE